MMKSYVFPGDIEDEIRQIAAHPIPYMRTSEFSKVMKEIEEMLLALIHCTSGKVISYTASGTGAMDAVVSCYLPLKGKAFILVGGSFGHRWEKLCEYYNYPKEIFEVPFAKDIDYDALERAVAISCPKVFLCQHHETSTGQLFDLQKISSICHRYGVSLVVDAISSFLADPLDMDALGIDICIVSSQKGLNILPGLSFVFLSSEIKDEAFVHNNYYFDFRENLINLERGQTPYSPATALFMQLHARLEMNMKIGADTIVDSVREKALFFRQLCLNNGWDMPAETPSNCITGFFVHKNGDILFAELIKRGIYIMPGGTPHYFRVSHLGLQTFDELEQLAVLIKKIETNA